MTLLSSHLGPCDMDQKLSPFVILITTSHMDELDLGIELRKRMGWIQMETRMTMIFDACHTDPNAMTTKSN